MTAVCIAGAAQHAFASGEFASLWDGIWWAVTTATTVGYGDLYPTTVQGRIIGMVLMFVGIGFLSLLTAAIASRFVKEERGEEHDEVHGGAAADRGEVAELKARLPVRSG